jgi:hypothetical protein
MPENEAATKPPLLDANEACRFLGGVCRRTLTNLVHRGELAPIRILGRRMYRRADLERLARLGTRQHPAEAR